MRKSIQLARSVHLTLTLVGLTSIAAGQMISQPVAAGIPARSNAPGKSSPPLAATGAGIQELIADSYKKRYQQWKTEFLSTATGRQQWQWFAQHPRLRVTITVSRGLRKGAQTRDFQWSDDGELIAATITLGSHLHKGFPDPARYPVTSALALRKSPEALGALISDRLLAAAKLAHEFGHVSQAARADGANFRLQNQLTPIYLAIFKSCEYNIRDPRLVELARRMGGTPLEVQDDREYWGEASAMLYLGERIRDQRLRRVLFAEIRRSVELYANGGKGRYLQLLDWQESGDMEQLLRALLCQPPL